MSNLQDVKTPVVQLQLGDNTYPIQYSLNAFADLEEYYSSLSEAMEKMQKGSVSAIRALLWAGTADMDENLRPTIKQLGAQINFSNLQDISTKLLKALEASVPEQKAVPNSQTSSPKVIKTVQ